MYGYNRFQTSWGKAYFSEKQIKNGVYCKRVKEKNIFQKYGAWGMSVSVLRELMRRGIEQIELTCKDDNTVYTTTVEKFETDGIDGQYGNAERQKFLRITPSNFEMRDLK